MERASDSAYLYGNTNNLRTEIIRYAANATDAAVGRTKSIVYPDGQMVSHSYEYGDYTADPEPSLCTFSTNLNGSALMRTDVRGTTDAPAGIENKTTKNTTVFDQFSHEVMMEQFVYDGSDYEKVSWTVISRDGRGRVETTYSSDGTQSDNGWSASCCAVGNKTDRSGIVHQYGYDLLDRRITDTKEGANGASDVVRAVTLDALGRTITSTMSDTNGLSLMTSSNSYNVAGDLISSVDSLGIETTSINDIANHKRTTIRAGVTNETFSYIDGRTKYTTQNGAIQSYYTYGVNSDGATWTKVYTGPDGTNSPVWQKSTTDALGRTILTEKPGFDGSTVETANYYNGVGQLTNSVTAVITKNDERSTQNSTLYEYNELGEQIRSGQDINANGIIDLAGPDKVSERYSAYEADASSDIWRISYSVTYPLDNSSAPVTNGISRTRITGLGGDVTATVDGIDYTGKLTSESVSQDMRGNQTISRTIIDRANKTVVQVSTSPDSINDKYQVTINGITTKSVSKTGIVMTYGYDALGRRLSLTDPRTGTSTTTYAESGRVAYTTDASTNHVWVAYDPETGRQFATIRNASPVAQASLLADSLASTPEATVVSLLSDTNYSVQVSHYSTEGQLLATWGNTYPVMYAYDDFDRMSDMYTYRGTNEITSYASLVTLAPSLDRTTWQYDEVSGLLTNKLYAADENGIRKGTAYTYTEDGKLATRSWARGITTTYSYLPCCGALETVDYSDDTPDVAYTYNRIGQQLTAGNGVADYAYQYDPATMALTNEIQDVNGRTNTIARTQDDLGRPVGLGLRTSPTMQEDYAVSYGYGNDGQFHQVIWGGTTATYSRVENSSLLSGYTIDDQLSVSRTYEEHRNLLIGVANTVGATQISTFDYSNDPLGRRTRRLDTLNGVLASTNDFAYNPRSEVIGAAMGNNAYNYDYDSIGNRLLMSNSVGSVSSVVDFSSSPLNQYTNIIASGVSPESPVYDDDGNMLTKGEWSFAWNGENRMVQASNSVSGVVVANAYDHQGRRITKAVGGTTRIFTYDGWNLISEQSTLNSQLSTNYYVWGLDLSGSAQGAGGIGGLLATVLEGEAYFSCFDANGNLTDYVDANGTVQAHYEYGPFGGTISSSGDMADDFAYRFSTKYLDEETALYYYGFRYYSPELGRWVNRDPIGELGARTYSTPTLPLCVRDAPETLSRVYTCLRNNLILRSDYLGLFDASLKYPCTETQNESIEGACEAVTAMVKKQKENKVGCTTCIEKAFKERGISMPEGFSSSLGASLGELSRACNNGGGLAVGCPPLGNEVDGIGTKGCNGSNLGYSLPTQPKRVFLCPNAFGGGADGVGGLECVLLHEMMHSLWKLPGGSSTRDELRDELLVVEITKCFSPKCGGYNNVRKMLEMKRRP